MTLRLLFAGRPGDYFIQFIHLIQRQPNENCPPMDAVLVATLGAEAQVVSLATALLLRQERLARVEVVHTDIRFPPIDTALPALRRAFAARAAMSRCWHAPPSMSRIR